MSIWFELLNPIMKRFRKKRAIRIKNIFEKIEDFKVLDLGGSLHYWNAVEKHINPKELIILNISLNQSVIGDERLESGRRHIVLYDGNKIPFDDNYFDLVICNSVIEHVPPEDRIPFVEELNRVSSRYIVQTPAFEFPLEPHFIMPFIHWLPRKIGRSLANYTPYAFLANRSGAKAYFDEVKLLKQNEIEALLPDGFTQIEKFLGLKKSYSRIKI